MDEKQIELHLNDHDHEIGSLKHRVKSCEEKVDTLLELTTSVHDLSINMKHMLEEQKKQGARLEALEKAPAEDAKYVRRQILASVIGAIAGALLGALLALILK